MNRMLFCTVISIFVLASLSPLQANTTPPKRVAIVGGGIIGTLEAYYAYLEAKTLQQQVRIVMYDKNKPFSKQSASTNTSFNIAPSLTVDEILSVVPRGQELVERLAVLFSQPGGIRVDDVQGINDSEASMRFKEAVVRYAADKNHNDRTQALLNLGKMSMQLWQNLYDTADDELKAIFKASNFNPSRDPVQGQERQLHDGYRIDLLHGIPHAKEKALEMKETYSQLGYTSCALLSPNETVAIDPFLIDFCKAHSEINPEGERQWKSDSIALWRPGGCIDTSVFLPKFCEYLEKMAGTYVTSKGKTKDCFRIKFEKEVVSVVFDSDPSKKVITGLGFSDGSQKHKASCFYLFCPGEAVGTLRSLGFAEPEYAGFAGPVVRLNITASPDELAKYQEINHCMEVHKEGIVLAWQARAKENSIAIAVGGTKAFYGDRAPKNDEDFAKNRHLTQLNMINEVLPELVSLACNRKTAGKELIWADLIFLEEKGILERWVGRRSVAYDGFPTLGVLFHQGTEVANARCTTHLGSGGVSFAPAAVNVSRFCKYPNNNPHIAKVLRYADSKRTPVAS